MSPRTVVRAGFLSRDRTDASIHVELAQPPVGRKGWVLLVLTLVVAAVLFIASRTDAPASDPIWYAAVSHEIAADPSHVFSGQESHPFIMRIGLTVPLALLYRIVGTTALVTAVPMICAALLVVLVAFAAASTLRARILALLLIMSSGALLVNATELGVDLPCGALLAVSVLCLHRRGTRGWIVGAIVSWFAAFLVKETALWFLPVWIYVVVFDTRAHGGRALVRAYAPALITGGLLALLYLVWCNSVWGTPFARFTGIETLHHEWSLEGQSPHVWLERMTWRPVAFYGALLKGAVLGVIAAPFLLRGRDRLWAVASITLVAMHWFGSSSLTSYSPLPLIERMGLLALPCSLVASGLAFDAALSRLGPRSHRAIAAVIVVTVLVPFVITLSRALRRGHPETDAFGALHDEISQAPGPMILVCGDRVCPELAAYYLGFTLPHNLTISTPDQLKTSPCPHDARVRALVNKRRGARLHQTGGDFSAPIQSAPRRTIFERGHVALYDIRDCAHFMR